LNAVPVFAFNPGPITGEGNWTWFIPGRVPTLIDAGTGEAAHLDAVHQALSGARIGPREGGHHVQLQQVLVTHGHIDHASGAPALQQRYLAPLLAGEKIGSFATTEPDASTDLSIKTMQTFANREGGGYVVNGRKVRIETLNQKAGQIDAKARGEQISGDHQVEPINVDDEHFLWKFNGEYWKDELGFYRFKIRSRCPKK